jgi:integrase
MDLTPQRLQAWLAMLARTPARGGGTLSPRTIGFAMAVLRAAIADAVRLGTLADSPFKRVRGPHPKPKVVAAFSLAQVRRLDQVAASHRLGLLFAFLWQTGLRIGEALALRWSDLDLPGGSLQVRRSVAEVSGRLVEGAPKTAAGLREIALAGQTVTLLQNQAGRLRDEGLGTQGLVFPSRRGTTLSRRNVTRTWLRLRHDAGLPPYGLHALRHTNASLQLQAGVGLREIAAHLGHENPALTARVYAHVLVDTRRKAAFRLTRLLEEE